MADGNPDAAQKGQTNREPLTNSKGKRICGADRGRNKPPCGSTILGPNGRCKMHGGTAKRGPESPNWKHGKYSVWLPKDIMAAAERDMQDPEFRKVDLSLSLLNRAMQQQAAKAFKGRKPETVAAALKAFGDLAVKRSKVLTEETRRAAASADAISRVKLAVIMGAFAQVVRQTIVDSPHVTDPGRLLAELQANWRKGSAPMRVNGVTLPAEANHESQSIHLGDGEADTAAAPLGELTGSDSAPAPLDDHGGRWPESG
jgi:hypothetical protein